ncbi:MAG: amidohydrolase [Alphaproteobacteria bacterium]|nr:amidohydrolase [Alphaproteobacteria bacterium]
MRVIDFRVRPPFKGFLSMVMYQQAARRDRFTAQIGFAPAPSAAAQSMELLIQEMDRAKIMHAVIVGRHSALYGTASNDDVMEVCRAYPGRFIAVASIDPADRRQAMATVKSALAQGFKAVNIEPGAYATPLYPDDRRLYPIYAVAEDAKVPVIMMTGGNAGPDLSYSLPVGIDRVLADFPTLKVAVSHGNWPWVNEILHVAFRRANLYVSPDMYLPNMPGQDDYVKAADGFLADRFLYASSYPFAPVDKYLDWFLKLPIRPVSMEKVLYRNAAAFLGL